MNEERPNPEDAPGSSPAPSAAEAAETPVLPDGDDAVAQASHADPEPGSDQTAAHGAGEAGAEGEAPAAGDEAPSGPATSALAANDTPESGDEDDEEEDPSPVWVPEPDKLLLSLLFASHEYLDARGLREIMGPEWDTPRLRQLVRKLNRDLESGDLPFEIAETDGTFRLRTLPKYFPWTRKLFKDAAPRRLSQAALETLAIVAYKQPVTKAEIEAIRGVNVDGSMKTLLDKRLIDIGRRTDTLGQAFTYHTTREFMRYFGINRVPDDLPRLSEFEGILNAQSLIPQMGDDGEVQEFTRPDEDGEQLTLGMDGSTSSSEKGSGKDVHATTAVTNDDDVDDATMTSGDHDDFTTHAGDEEEVTPDFEDDDEDDEDDAESDFEDDEEDDEDEDEDDEDDEDESDFDEENDEDELDDDDDEESDLDEDEDGDEDDEDEADFDEEDDDDGDQPDLDEEDGKGELEEEEEEEEDSETPERT